MKNFINKYLQFCPKTGRFLGVKQLTGLSRLLFPLIGIAAMVWILIRVIPKPSRLSYPCVQTAMPLASGFVGYLAMLALTTVAFFRSKKPLRYYPVFFLGAFMVFGISGFLLFDTNLFQNDVQLTVNAVVDPNVPIGVAKGIFPGRVVWVHNPNATNENWVASNSNGYFATANNNQTVIDGMVSSAIQNLTGKSSDSAAWRAIFEFHNTTRGKGAVNYVPGEKIMIKTNAVSGWGGNYSTTDLSKSQNGYYNVTETSPAFVLSILRQLVRVVGVADTNIYVGDPLRHVYKHCYDLWRAEFPGVHYLDYNLSVAGREKVVVSSTAKISYSDRGTILRDNGNYTNGTNPIYRDNLYTVYEKAEYLISLPILKGHMRAGVTMFAKNNFGAHTRSAASHLHNGLVAPQEMSRGITRPGYGLYRVQVDFMAHSLLGKKMLVYLMDALWSTDYELDKPLKWQMPPFNNDFSSSVFASLDNVAIESVGYDFLRSEFTVQRHLMPDSAGTYPQMPGVDDYLHQAADSANWPAGIKYDPDSTGTYFSSLGVHEHWNNATEKKYTRNLNPTTGTGIELIDIEQGTSTSVANQESRPNGFELYQNYPNPFNPSTSIAYSLPERSSVAITIYDIQGRAIKSFTFNAQSAGYQRVVWNGTNDLGNLISSGVYMYRVTASSLENGKVFDKSAKMTLLK